ncbi:MAG: TlpA disulfide reductase family protein [Candidatus Korarchaeota archaeon]|nr:TlpA disulfide reductase family protein [Candidatus Korarchaeota archaeon]
MNRRLRLITLATAILLVTGASSAIAQPKVGTQAPNFTLASPYGYNLTLSELLSEGKPVILVFFAHYCPHCQAEITQLSGEWAYCPNSDKATVLLVGVSGDEEADRALFEEHRVDGWEFAEATQQVALDYRLLYVPTIVVVGPDGQVKFAKVGETQPNQLCELVGRYYVEPSSGVGLPAWVLALAAPAAVGGALAFLKLRSTGSKKGRKAKRSKQK